MAYLFEPTRLQQVVQPFIGQALPQLFEGLVVALSNAYPQVVDQRRWIFNNAGGAMGQIRLLYASLSEYLMLFGTPIGTEGHSGRYATEVWDVVLAGEMWTYLEGQVDRTVHRPGEMAYLGRSQAKGYRIPDFVWMLEYARGPIPTMLPFGLADAATSTLDLRAFGRTMWTYSRCVFRSLCQGRL